MRLTLIAAIALLAAPASALANHQPDTEYDGVVTTGQGGTVHLDVSANGNEVDASFTGLGNAANSCFGVGFGTGFVPVTNHSFAFSGNGGQVGATGSFGPSFAAGGAQVLTSPCTTGSQAWIVKGPDITVEHLNNGGLGGLGDDVLNATGEGQTIDSKVRQGETDLYRVAVGNRATGLASYSLKGCGSGDGFKVTYSHEGQDRTNPVTSGNYETGLLDPPTSQVDRENVELTIKVKRTATVGRTLRCKLTSRSAEFKDVARVNVKARKALDQN